MNAARTALTFTRLSIASRWRTLRGPGSRAWAWCALAAALVMFQAAQGLGDTIMALAELDDDSTASLFAQSYITTFVTDGFAAMTAAVLGFTLAVTALEPLIAPMGTGLIPQSDRAGFTSARMARYTDSVVAHLMTLTTGLQLLALTALGSMLTLDGEHRARALLTSWALWCVLVLAGPALGWAREYARRTKAPWVAALAGVGAGALAVALVVDDAHGTDLFGAGPYVTASVTTAPVGPVAVALLACAAVALGAGWALCSAALKHPAPAGTTRARKPRALATGTRAVLYAVTWRSVVRTRAIVIPLVGATVLGMILAWTGGGSPRSVASVLVIVPMTVALSWQVNSLTLVGPASSWWASLPGVSRATATVHAVVATALMAGALVASFGPALVAGRLELAQAGSVAVASCATVAVTSGVATVLALTWPRNARVESGAPLVPAATTIAYTLGLVLTGGLVGAGLTLGPQLLSEDGGQRLAGLSVIGPWAVGAAGVGALLVVGGVLVWSRSSVRRAAALSAVAR